MLASKLKTGLAVGITLASVTGLYVVAHEQDSFSIPAGQVEVVVLGVQHDKPQGKTPAWFQYSVALPDGTTATFVSDRVQPSGARLLVTAHQGRFTKRRWLSAPYRVLADHGESSAPR